MQSTRARRSVGRPSTNGNGHLEKNGAGSNPLHPGKQLIHAWLSDSVMNPFAALCKKNRWTRTAAVEVMIEAYLVQSGLLTLPQQE